MFVKKIQEKKLFNINIKLWSELQEIFPLIQYKMLFSNCITVNESHRKTPKTSFGFPHCQPGTHLSNS